MTLIRCLILAASLMINALTMAARADTLYLASLEWPPYSGPDLPAQGVSVAIVRAAIEAMGHELVVEFFPWSRAVSMGRNTEQYTGYFPEYYFESDEFVFSDPLGQGPLGFVEAVSDPIEWESIIDLTQFQVGIVQDYVNTAELDQLIASGQIQAQVVTSDLLNVLKVAGGRINLAVIDSNVLDYLLDNDPRARSVASSVQMNSRLLANMNLHIAFKDDAEGRRWLEIFNQGLERVAVDSAMDDES